MNNVLGKLNAETRSIASTGKNALRVRSFRITRRGGVFLAAELMLLSTALLEAVRNKAIPGACILIGCCALILYLNALHSPNVRSGKARFWVDLSEALCCGTGAGMLIFYIFPVLGSGMHVVLAGLPLAGMLPVAIRRVAEREKLVESMLIIGNGKLAEKLHRALSTGNSASGQQETSHVLRFPGSQAESGRLTDFSQLPDILQRERISRVIVAEEDAQCRNRLATTLMTPCLGGLLVNEAGDYYERFFGKVWIDTLTPDWFVYTSGFRRSTVNIFVKRCFDVFFALLLLTLAAPLLLIIAIAIKLESAGPALFRQLRVGLEGKTFVMYKFRSMRQDAEFHAGPTWAKECDDRVTRIGRALRRLHLDEIPQALNVLRGEMSFVGPRPERPYFVDRLAQEIPYYNVRHCVKPGITGLAQVKYRYGASVEDAVEKLQYDLYYAKHWSAACDAEILVQTVGILLARRGSR